MDVICKRCGAASWRNETERLCYDSGKIEVGAPETAIEKKKDKVNLDHEETPDFLTARRSMPAS